MLKKAKFLQDAKLDPARFYRNPSDVMRDRRLTNEDRAQILAAWERNTLAAAQDGFCRTPPDQLDRVREIRAQLDRDFVPTDATAAALSSQT